jgi:hypothetical protein
VRRCDEEVRNLTFTKPISVIDFSVSNLSAFSSIAPSGTNCPPYVNAFTRSSGLTSVSGG